MSIDPETIQVGQCYLTIRGKVRRVTALSSDRVQFQQRLANQRTWRANKFYLLDLPSFTRAVQRVVSRDWLQSEPIVVQADTLRVGTCYLAENGTVRRVVSAIEGRVAFAQRPASSVPMLKAAVPLSATTGGTAALRPSRRFNSGA